MIRGNFGSICCSTLEPRRSNEPRRAGKRRVKDLRHFEGTQTVALLALADRGEKQDLLDHFE